MSKDISKLIQDIVKFRNDRDWKQFHNPKDMALSLVLESTELLEHFQWKNTKEVEKYIVESKSDIADELADVLYWVLLMSHDLNIDISLSLKSKLKKNAEKYPIDKAKGKHKKYTEL
jgi:dCTP diphosphatase